MRSESSQTEERESGERALSGRLAASADKNPTALEALRTHTRRMTEIADEINPNSSTSAA